MNFERLKDIRENLDYKQIDIANILGVSQRSYSRWETGEEIIPLKRLIQFCNFFHITLDYAMGLTNKKIKTNYLIVCDSKYIGNRLKEFRKNHHITQVELANFLCTTHSTISAYESGKTLLLTAFAYQICKTYSISMDWLCTMKK